VNGKLNDNTTTRVSIRHFNFCSLCPATASDTIFNMNVEPIMCTGYHFLMNTDNNKNKECTSRFVSRNIIKSVILIRWLISRVHRSIPNLLSHDFQPTKDYCSTTTCQPNVHITNIHVAPSKDAHIIKVIETINRDVCNADKNLKK